MKTYYFTTSRTNIMTSAMVVDHKDDLCSIGEVVCSSRSGHHVVVIRQETKFTSYYSTSKKLLNTVRMSVLIAST